MNQRNNIKRLVENAIDFLDHALVELERSPKYSVIHFYAAVELLLKARLLAEHWTLVIAKRHDADHKRFLAGDFQSVTLEEAAARLDKVIESPLTAAELGLFRGLSKHRNRMMHFYHDAIGAEAAADLKKAVAIEQLRAWYVLNRLLLDRWGKVFKHWKTEFERVSANLRKYRAYLQVTFEAVEPHLHGMEAGGAAIEECPACGYPASEVQETVGLVNQCACLVCQLRSAQVMVQCPGCGGQVKFVGDGFAKCDACGAGFEPHDLASLLDEDEHGTKDYFESGMPAHCTLCNGIRTVVHHGGECVCASCLASFGEDEMRQCGWCGDLNAGELEHSHLTGCVVCGGSMGNLEDD